MIKIANYFVKAAFVAVVMGMAGLVVSCNDSNDDPETPDVPKVAKSAKLTMTYTFGRDMLSYCDVKMVYTDNDGKTVTVPVKQKDLKVVEYLSLTGGPYELYGLTKDIEYTKFPASASSHLTFELKDSTQIQRLPADHNICYGVGVKWSLASFDEKGDTIATAPVESRYPSSVYCNDEVSDDMPFSLIFGFVKQTFKESKAESLPDFTVASDGKVTRVK